MKKYEPLTCGCCGYTVTRAQRCACERTETCEAAGFCVGHCPCDDCVKYRVLLRGL